MTDTPPSQARKQALRLKRFLLASVTYALVFVVLGLCNALGLLAADRLAVVGAAFLVANIAFFCVIRSGGNLRFADPSLTQPQVYVAAGMVALILVLGEKIQFLAVPFYSSIFVFAMLQLKPRELIRVEIFVLGTYCAAIAMRVKLFSSGSDLGIEAINVVLVVMGSAWFAVAASYISNLRARLRDSVHTIEQLAIRDGLTDTWNRRHIDALLLSEMQRKARMGGALCGCLVDIDHFKAINDRFGHLAGDAVLKSVAACIKAELRLTDQLGRFGGEEFLVVLPGTSLTEATVCAERLRHAVAASQLLPDPQLRVHISIGLAECMLGETCVDYLARIDRALYQAKREGRNRVAVGVRQEPLPA